VTSVVPQDVHPAVVGHHLEVSVPRPEPAIEQLLDLEAPFLQIETSWGLLAAISGVAFNLQPGEARRIDALNRHFGNRVEVGSSSIDAVVRKAESQRSLARGDLVTWKDLTVANLRTVEKGTVAAIEIAEEELFAKGLYLKMRSGDGRVIQLEVGTLSSEDGFGESQGPPLLARGGTQNEEVGLYIEL